MRVTTVSYKKIFPTAPYVNLTIGVEIQVDEGEVAEDALDLAKQTVEEWYMADKLAEEAIKRNGLTAEEYKTLTTPVKVEVKQPKEFTKTFHEPIGEINLQHEKIEIAIENAQTIDELNALNKNGLPISLIAIFNKKVKELKNK